MIAASVVGYAATFVGTSMMLPQVVQIARTRRAADISLGTVLCYLGNCILWLAYGILISSGPVEVGNVIGLAIGIVQLALKMRYRNRP